MARSDSEFYVRYKVPASSDRLFSIGPCTTEERARKIANDIRNSEGVTVVAWVFEQPRQELTYVETF
jgi:hypothetical protein